MNWEYPARLRPVVVSRSICLLLLLFIIIMPRSLQSVPPFPTTKRRQK